jgi:transcriptional regulator with XRE-family HTH domain
MSIAAFNLIAPPMTPMAPDEKAFCKAMGERIAEARKDHHMTQVQLAELLGVMQQTLAHYEVGRRRVPVSMLPLLATTLAVSVEELIGVSSPAGPAKIRDGDDRRRLAGQRDGRRRRVIA